MHSIVRVLVSHKHTRILYKNRISHKPVDLAGIKVSMCGWILFLPELWGPISFAKRSILAENYSTFQWQNIHHKGWKSCPSRTNSFSQTTWALNPWGFFLIAFHHPPKKKKHITHLYHPPQVQEQRPQRVFCSAFPSPWVFHGVHPGEVVS